jgi:SAM-dependent methyltransferase
MSVTAARRLLNGVVIKRHQEEEQPMRAEIRELARKVYTTIDPLNVFVYKLLHRKVTSVPPASNRMRVGSRGIGRFMAAGRNCYVPLKAALTKYASVDEGKPRILDFGCGVGRVLQYFAREPVELFACDVDASAVSYLQSEYPAVRCAVNDYEPPLPYADGKFDAVYSVSIWTHLPPDQQIPWLLEIQRVLKPGGLALLTTIGPYGYRRGTHLWAVTFNYEDLLRDGLCYSAYKTQDPGTGPSYGAAYHTPDYVRREWGKHFDVLEVQEGAIDNLNDLVILRKRA